MAKCLFSTAKIIKSPEEVEEEFEDESPILKNELNLAVQVRW